MTTTTETLTDDQLADRRRGRWLVLGLVTVLVLFVTGTALAQRYEPLQRGSLSGGGDGKTVTDPQTGEDEIQLPFRPGATASVLVSVRNSGRFGVTVDGVQPDDPGVLFGLVGATATTNEAGKDVSLPYRLAPGKEVGLRLTYRLPRCGLLADSAALVDSVPVRWHAFRSNHVTVLPQTLVTFRVPAGETGSVTRPC